MLSENEYVISGNETMNNLKVAKGFEFYWQCTVCGEILHCCVDDIEKCVDSDPHDPLIEYLMCDVCDKGINIYNKKTPVAFDDGTAGELWSDGSYIYIRKNGEVLKVV